MTSASAPPSGSGVETAGTPHGLVKSGIEEVREAPSYRLKMTMFNPEGVQIVNDIRIVPEKGNRMTITVPGEVTEVLVVGETVYRKPDSAEAWERLSVKDDPELRNGQWFKDSDQLMESLHRDARKGTGVMTFTPSLTIDGVLCTGVRHESTTLYLTPGPAGHVRRVVAEDPEGDLKPMTWDITELGRPIDLTPPTSFIDTRD